MTHEMGHNTAEWGDLKLPVLHDAEVTLLQPGLMLFRPTKDRCKVVM